MGEPSVERCWRVTSYGQFPSRISRVFPLAFQQALRMRPSFIERLLGELTYRVVCVSQPE